MSTAFEAEETIKRIKSHKGVQAVLIVNNEGVPIYSSDEDEEFAIDHAALISQVRTLFCQVLHLPSCSCAADSQSQEHDSNSRSNGKISFRCG